MRATIYPGKLQGTIRVPSSPALTQRAILGACLCDSHTLIRAECADAQTLALEGVLAEAGFPVAHDGTHYLCRGHGAFRQNAVIDCQKNIAALDFLLPVSEPVREVLGALCCCAAFGCCTDDFVDLFLKFCFVLLTMVYRGEWTIAVAFLIAYEIITASLPAQKGASRT